MQSTDAETAALKRFIKRIESGVSVNAADTPAEPGQIGVLKTSCVYTGMFNPGENKTVVEEELDRVACPVRADTLIVSRMNTPDLVGAAGLALCDMSNVYLPDRLWQVHFQSNKVLPRYVYWWTRSELYRNQVKAACAGASSSMQNLDQDSFRSFRIPQLPRDRQVSIANFLDEQTARIDALIAGKEKLVELLSELRSSRLAHEMAGGRHGDKETHYRWYPGIPSDWNVVPFKHVVHFVEGPGILANDFRVEGVPLLRVAGVRGATATLEGCNYLDPAKVDKTWSHFRVRQGDLLISASASMGTVSLVTDETEGSVPYTGIIILRPREGVLRDFVRNFVVSEQFMRQVDGMKTGSTIQHFGPSHLNRVVMALPSSLNEQEKIVQRLEDSRRTYDSMENHVRKHIDILREYRSSLISAAVTGQIDINNFQLEAA